MKISKTSFVYKVNQIITVLRLHYISTFKVDGVVLDCCRRLTCLFQIPVEDLSHVAIPVNRHLPQTNKWYDTEETHVDRVVFTPSSSRSICAKMMHHERSQKPSVEGFSFCILSRQPIYRLWETKTNVKISRSWLTTTVQCLASS